MWLRRRGQPLAGDSGGGNVDRDRFRFHCSSLRDLFSLTGGGAASPVLHRTISASFALGNFRCSSTVRRNAENPVSVVLYFTSLRAVRKTFDDCRAVRGVLRGLGVAVDERDVSMDSSFLSQLHSLVKHKQAKISLPQLFVDGECVGGAEEVRRLHESGELKKLLSGAPQAVPVACPGCGGIGFAICEVCDGRHSVFVQKVEGFRTCDRCNEYGLVRCPLCSSPCKAWTGI